MLNHLKKNIYQASHFFDASNNLLISNLDEYKEHIQKSAAQKAQFESEVFERKDGVVFEVLDNVVFHRQSRRAERGQLMLIARQWIKPINPYTIEMKLKNFIHKNSSLIEEG